MKRIRLQDAIEGQKYFDPINGAVVEKRHCVHNNPFWAFTWDEDWDYLEDADVRDEDCLTCCI